MIALRASITSNGASQAFSFTMFISFWILDHFTQKTSCRCLCVQVLLIAALVSFALALNEAPSDGNAVEQYVEPFVILLILVINAFIGVWQESDAARALDALKDMQTESSTCIRDAQVQHAMPSKQLVPGDIIYLSAGSKAMLVLSLWFCSSSYF